MSDRAPSEILEKKLLTDLSQVDALSSPIRMRILQGALEPVTVGALAERFGVPKTRLYYHVNLLVREGLLVQVDERMSGARVERIYRTVARTFAPGPELSESVDDARHAARLEAGLTLDPARTEAETMLEKKLGGGSTIGDVARLMVRVTDEDAREFSGGLAKLCAELGPRSAGSSGDGEARLYAFSFVFAPADLGADS
jgi:hypothetical protein